MIYHSTRSLENGVNAREALLKGLCDDGGLYVSLKAEKYTLTHFPAFKG